MEPAGIIDAVLPTLVADDAATMEAQLALAAIAAPTGHEERRAAALDARLTQAGLRPRRDAAGNVVVVLGPAGDAPVVACAHLDTVFDAAVALRPVIDGGRIRCPGIGDNARGLATLLAIARLIARGGIVPARPLVLAATVGEEGAGDLCGARHLFGVTCPDAVAAVAIDGPGDSRIVCDAIGVRRVQLRIAGPGGHSWTAHDTPNPLVAATTFVSAVASLPWRHHPRTTITVTRVHGGEAINAIPADATVDVEVRSADAAVLRSIVSAIGAAAEAAVARENTARGAGHAPLSSALSTVSDRPAGVTPSDHPLVRHCATATRAIGRHPELAMASTDANIPMHLGIPAIALGGGGAGGDAHTPLEWFANVDGPLGIARVAATLLATTGVA